MRNKFVILLKTFLDDLVYIERLIPSFNKHNIDNVPLYLVVPQKDINTFDRFLNQNVKILSEELFKDKLTLTPVCDINPGYINQEIIKISFWELDLCENYFCLDSDCEFIRDFYISDFMFDDDTPYTILIEDNELKVEPEYYNSFWVPREEKIRLIQNEIGFIDKRMLTCHGNAVLSAKVLNSFKSDFLIARNKTYIDILEIAPYEFSWYNIWLQKKEIIPIKVREPLFKVFHHENHLIDYIRRGTSLNDIARGYIGITINSNWQKSRYQIGPINYETYIIKEQTIENYSYMELIRSIIKKIRKKVRGIYKA
jgi:hypothetical protein